MEKAQSKKPTLQDIFRWITSTIGMLLLSFCLLSNILVFVLSIPDGSWAFPIIVLPANFICMTFGMDYWIGKDPFRRWAYCISNIIVTVLLLVIALDYGLSHNYTTPLGFFAAILLPILVILYSFRTALKKKTCVQSMAEINPSLPRSSVRLWLRAVIRILCLLSICCVLFESWHRSILFFYHLLMIPNIYLSNQVRNQIVLSILSPILLAKFVKAEFVQWKPSLD